MDKLKWYIIDKEYINFLRQYEDKVENINYNEKLKPYIGILLEINEFNYYVPISSVKEKHYKMSEGIDFIKIIRNKKLMAVLNLNNMIPILDYNVKKLQYRNIIQYRKFNTNDEKDKYIAFLNTELSLINKKSEKIKQNAFKLYNERINNPQSNVSKRCCNFKLLEKKCIEYKNNIKTKK